MNVPCQYNPMDGKMALLQTALSAAVPLWIEKIRHLPLDELISLGPDMARFIGEKGDIIQFKSKKPGETASAFNELAKAVAILSFFPGGVRIFGLHFEAEHPDNLSPFNEYDEIP